MKSRPIDIPIAQGRIGTGVSINRLTNQDKGFEKSGLRYSQILKRKSTRGFIPIKATRPKQSRPEISGTYARLDGTKISNLEMDPLGSENPERSGGMKTKVIKTQGGW